MKTFLYFLLPLCFSLLISCQETDDDLGPTLPPTGCDGDLKGTDCQQFFIPEGATLSFPTGTEIKASEGIEINGNIVIDPTNGGDFTITATSGDIVIAGKILVKDTASGNPSGGRYKRGKSSSRIKNGKAADGFTLTLNARGPNGNIILQKGATLFSGRGQHAYTEKLLSIIDSHEGAAGGNGGLIILNAPNGKVKLPDLSNPVTPYQDELFVLGNGGDGANVKLDENMETFNLDVVDVRGGLGGNAGQLIIDADEIEGIPSLEEMQTHPDFIYGGKGGQGGNVIWDLTYTNKKYTFQEILLHGGDGGEGAKTGGNGGLAVFLPLLSIVEVGDLVPNVFCYGGDGGDVFASPLPHQSVWGGEGGACGAFGVRGWSGGIDSEGNIFRDGADGGNALGQGGNGGNILTGCRAYLAVGGNGSFSDQARTALPALFGDADYLYTRFRVWAGNGGYGYEDCEGCPGGDGGNAGTATAIGGKGGDVLGEAIQSIGGDGGDTWGIVRGRPGDGGNGNPAGKAGGQPFDPPLFDNPGEGGNGTTVGPPGETLGFDALKEMAIDAHNGETCGEEAACEYDDMEFPTDEESCRKEGAGFVYKVTEITTNANSMSETIINIIGTYVEEGCGGSSCFMCDRTRTQTITYTDGREPRIYTTNGTGLCSTMISPFCTQDGQLFYPAGNSSVSYSSGESTQITVSFTGCYADEQAPRTCCQGEDGRYYFWGDDTCPE